MVDRGFKVFLDFVIHGNKYYYYYYYYICLKNEIKTF